MRANEQVFATMRVALGEVARNAGRSEPGEQEGAFAARVRSAAEDALPPVEEHRVDDDVGDDFPGPEDHGAVVVRWIPAG